MEEEEEEFYDSLEEDQNYEPLKRLSSHDSEIFPKEKPSNSSIADSENTSKKSFKIPLYVGETDPEDLKIRRCVKVIGKKSSHTSCEASGHIKSKCKTEVVSKKKEQSSYWALYCQKNGISTETEANSDDAKSAQENTANKTFGSFISNCCLSGTTWDAPSEFAKYVPKRYATKNEKSSTSICDESEQDELTSNNLKSLSQTNISKTSTAKNSKTKLALSKSNTNNTFSLKPLTLKNISPDKIKLDRIKKQHEYGLKASIRNRAKIIQNLSKLKQDLEDS